MPGQVDGLSGPGSEMPFRRTVAVAERPPSPLIELPDPPEPPTPPPVEPPPPPPEGPVPPPRTPEPLPPDATPPIPGEPTIPPAGETPTPPPDSTPPTTEVPPTATGDPVTPVPPEPEPQPEKLKAVLVNESQNVDDKAQDREKAELTGKRGIIRRIWEGAIRPLQEERETVKARAKFVADQSFTGTDDAGKAAHERYVQRELARFADKTTTEAGESGVVSEVARYFTEAGETRRQLGEATDPKEAAREQEAAGLIQKLLLDRVSGDLNAENFDAARARTLHELTTKYPEFAGRKDLMFSDNLSAVAEAAIAASESKEVRRAMILETEIVLAQAKSFQRTEAQYNHADTLIRLAEKIPGIGKAVLAHETSVALALAALTTAGTFATRKVAGMARVGIIGVGSAGYAGMREHKQFTDKRAQHLRESAVGEQRQEGDKQRETLDTTKYEMRDATELRGALLTAMLPAERAEGDPPPQMTPEKFRSVVAEIAEIRTRMSLSDTKNIDLISYSSADQVMEERDKLIITVAQAEVFLQRFADSNPALKAEVLGDSSLREVINAGVEVNKGVIQQDIEAKDGTFHSERRKAVLKRMAIAGATGVIVGTVFQEAKSFMPGQDQVGLFEHHGGGAKDHRTALKSLWDTVSHHKSEVKTDPSDLAHPLKLDDTHDIILPKGVKIVPDGEPGSFKVSHDGQLLAEKVKLGGDNLDPASAEKLRAAGVMVHETREAITTTHTGVDQVLTAKEHAAQYGHHVKREWMDNDTTKFDKDELRADLVVDPTNNHVYYDIGRMTNEGSYHNGVHENVKDMVATNRGKLLISNTRSTQATPGVFDFNGTRADLGEVNGNSYVHMVNGRPKLSAAFAEVGDPVGKVGDADKYRILATDVGPGIDHVRIPGQTITDTVMHHTLTIDGASQKSVTDIPYIIPIPTYTRLDSTVRPEAPSSPTGAGTPATIAPSEGGTRTEPQPAGEPRAPEPQVTPETPPEAKILSLWELKEEARKALGAMEAFGAITPEERKLVAGRIGRTTQSIAENGIPINGVSVTDLVSLFAVFHSYDMALTDNVDREAAAKRAAGVPEAEVEAERTSALNDYRRSMQIVMDSFSAAAERQKDQWKTDWEVGETASTAKIRPGQVIPAGQIFPEVKVPEAAETPSPTSSPAGGGVESEEVLRARVEAATPVIREYRDRLEEATRTGDVEALNALRYEPKYDSRLYRDPDENAGEMGRQPLPGVGLRAAELDRDIQAAYNSAVAAGAALSPAGATHAPATPLSTPSSTPESPQAAVDDREPRRRSATEVAEPIINRYRAEAKSRGDVEALRKIQADLRRDNGIFYRDPVAGETDRQPLEPLADLVGGFESQLQADIDSAVSSGATGVDTSSALDSSAPATSVEPSLRRRVVAPPTPTEAGVPEVPPTPASPPAPNTSATPSSAEQRPEPNREAQIVERYLSEVRAASEAGDVEALKAIQGRFIESDQFYRAPVTGETERQPIARVASTAKHVMRQIQAAIDDVSAKSVNAKSVSARPGESRDQYLDRTEPTVGVEPVDGEARFEEGFRLALAQAETPGQVNTVARRVYKRPNGEDNIQVNQVGGKEVPEAVTPRGRFILEAAQARLSELEKKKAVSAAAEPESEVAAA